MASAPVMRLAFPQGDEGLERIAPQHHDRLLAVSETDARTGQVELARLAVVVKTRRATRDPLPTGT